MKAGFALLLLPLIQSFINEISGWGDKQASAMNLYLFAYGRGGAFTANLRRRRWQATRGCSSEPENISEPL
jgi:hypothetical protein